LSSTKALMLIVARYFFKFYLDFSPQHCGQILECDTIVLMVQRWKYAAGAIIILIVVATAAAFGIYYHNKQELINLLPSGARQSIGFPVYLSKTFSESTAINERSVTYSGGVLFATYGQGDERVNITQQKRPDKLNIDRFANSDQLKGGQKIDTPLGKALTGTAGNQKVIFIDNEKTLIIIISASEKPSVEKHINSLKRIN
jgi:hypothetical protein